MLSLESRRAFETAELIRRNGGVPVIAPSMREVPIEANEEVFRFAGSLFEGRFDMAIFLTGVGLRYLSKVVASRWDQEMFAQALRKIAVVARGPKPIAVLREMKVPVAVAVPEPNTWREIVDAISGRPERQIALQLYGKDHPSLVAALESRGAEVTSVPVYQWALPEDVGPLRDAVSQLASGRIDVSLFTTSQQIVHLMQIASEMNLFAQVSGGLRSGMVVSIGPSTSEMLEEYGIRPAFEPSHPKLGLLVREAAERFQEG